MATVVVTPSINISPPTNTSSQHTPGSTCTVVPQYPYNVSMPSFAGALLPYERSPMPDDNDVQTRLPSRCVDYLSHDWDESDVWTSWKAMTRHKNEMANGVRLENASWRTWAKQRSNLKTISPETLNWLKDSDVTWLYGPLHTAVDPVPPPKLSSLQDRFNLDGRALPTESLSNSTVNSRPGSAASVRSTKAPGKPILKHRSLSEILGVGHGSSSQAGGGADSASDDGSDDLRMRRGQLKRARVSISHTSSDSTLVKRGHREGGRGSPPTLVSGYDSSDPATSGEDSDVARQSHSPTSKLQAHGNNSSGGSGGDEPVKPKKHISFSHRVEQCIAVDSEEERGAYAAKGQIRPNDRTSSSVASSALEEDDDDDDEDDLLTFRSSAPRHPGLHAVSNRYTSTSQATDSYGPQAGSSGSAPGTATPGEPFTIARMAPTTLKSSEVLPAPSPMVVYDRDPPWTGLHAHSSGPANPTYTVTSSPSGAMRADYPQPTASPLPSTNAGSAARNHQSLPTYPSRTYGPVSSSKASTAPINSPSHDDHSLLPTKYGSSSSLNQWGVVTPDDDDTEEFTAMGFDYFSGPDLGLGDEYDMSRLPSQHLSSFQNGYNPTEAIGMPGNNDDSSFPRSILKTQLITPPVANAVKNAVTGGLGPRLGCQGPILVPQVKSSPKPSAAPSSSSSSRSSSPLSHANDSSSSLIIPHSNNDKPNHISHPIAASSSSVNTIQERPDRLSRGRSSSRGSSASSFERSSIDRRPSSNSPTQSPPANLIATSTASIMASGSTAGGSSRLPTRPGGSTRANSYDGGRSFNRKSSLVSVTIGEEGEEDEDGSDGFAQVSRSSTMTDKDDIASGQKSGSPKASPTTSKLLSKNHSVISKASGSPERSSPGTKNTTHSTPSPSHKPCLISAPKLASAQLDGTTSSAPYALQVVTSDSREEGDLRRRTSSSTPETSITSSPTLLSLLSKQGPASSLPWWSEDKTSNQAASNEARSRLSPRPSLRPRNSDSNSSTSVGKIGRLESKRLMLGAGRTSNSMDAIRRISGDDFGFGNYYTVERAEEEEGSRDEMEGSGGGMISRAAEIVETAREIVGAIWSVGSRSIWGGEGEREGQDEEAVEHRRRGVVRRASTGGLGGAEDGGASNQPAQQIQPPLPPPQRSWALSSSSGDA